ncbi:NUDIX domain-containing protein [Streptomyces sp. NPDC058595]|uniref:NUDIX domain-containing protein n=1 Tax=Streptomyces sp. NPDC058595 TaxID=3346550 RepID=UPI0036529E4F
MTDTDTDTVDETIHLTADVVLFAGGHVLLIERGWDPFAGRWALPGGYANAGEEVLKAAVRELGEETGIVISTAELRQVGPYHAPGRDPRGRVVTIAYTATLPALVPPTAGDDATNARWWPLDALPDLAFDHDQILKDAQALAVA